MLQVSVTNTTMDFVVSDLELKPVPPYGVIFKSINGSLEMHSDFTAAINFFLTKVMPISSVSIGGVTWENKEQISVVLF